MYSLTISFIVANCVLTVLNKDNNDDDVSYLFYCCFVCTIRNNTLYYYKNYYYILGIVYPEYHIELKTDQLM